MHKCQTLSSDKLLFIDTSLPSYLHTMHSSIYQDLASWTCQKQYLQVHILQIGYLGWLPTTLLMNAMFDDFKRKKKKEKHMFHNLKLTLCKIFFIKKLFWYATIVYTHWKQPHIDVYLWCVTCDMQLFKSHVMWPSLKKLCVKNCAFFFLPAKYWKM